MTIRAAPYWFIGPAFILMLVILIAPIVIALVLSFSDYSLGSETFSWIGLENYERIATRSNYINMFTATAIYVVVVVPISVVLGLGVALLLQSLKFGRDLYKTVFFLPVMATLLAMAIVWEIALHPSIGLVNQTLDSFCGTGVEGFFSFGWLPFVDGTTSWYSRHCSDGFPLWLRDQDYALGTLCFIGIWQAFGFNMVLYLAGLTSIPRDLLQAAEMDGVKSSWERFRLVTWPMLGPTTVFVVTITSIRSFQVFDTVEALTKGGPSKSTYVMMYALYEKAVKQNLMGIGAAITIIFLVFVLFITLIQRHLVERRVHYS